MNLEEMWARLAQHQPFADRRGYGPEWAKMCEQRTQDAAAAAESAAWALALASKPADVAAKAAAKAAAAALLAVGPSWRVAQAAAREAAQATESWAKTVAVAWAAEAAARVATRATEALDWIKRSEEQE